MRRPLLTFLSKIDIFGSQIALTACQKEKFTSGFGGVLTMIVGICTLLFSIRSINNCFARQEAAISTQVMNVANPGPLQLNSSNFIFAIGYENNEYPLSSSIFNFQMKYIVRQQQPDGTVTSTTKTVPLVKCTLDYWEGYETEYKMYGLNNYLCPSTTNYILSGVRKGSNFSSFSLEVVSCVNLAYQPDVVCKSPADLATILPTNTAKISLIYTDNLFNFEDYESPVTRYVNYYSWSVAPGVFTKKVEIPVTQQVIATDGNLVLRLPPPNLNITYSINGNEKIDVAAPITSGSLQLYMGIQFVKNTQLFINTREFSKIDSVLSTIGGVGSMLIGLFAFVGVAYNQYAMKIQIANTLYEFDLQKGSSLENCLKRCCKRRRKVADENFMSPKNQLFSEAHSSLIRISTKNPTIEKIGSEVQKGIIMASFNNYEQSFGRSLPYSLWEYIKRIYNCGKRKEDRLADQASQRMEKEVDLTYIVKKLGEIEKLKEVLFNENQIEVFSYSRAPKIYLENELNHQKPTTTKNSSSKPNESPKKQSAREINTFRKFAILFRSYKKLMLQSKDPINQKLLDLIDSEMQNILYDLDFNLKMNPGLKEAFYKNLSVQAFEEMLERRRKYKESIGLTRSRAASIIARRLSIILRHKRMKKLGSAVKIQVEESPTREISESPLGRGSRKYSGSFMEKHPLFDHIEDDVVLKTI